MRIRGNNGKLKTYDIVNFVDSLNLNKVEAFKRLMDSEIRGTQAKGCNPASVFLG